MHPTSPGIWAGSTTRLRLGRRYKMSYIIIDSSADQELAKRLLASNFAGTVLEGAPETEVDYASGLIVSADQEHFDFDPNSITKNRDEGATNGASTVLRYDLEGCVVFVESGVNDCLAIYPAGATIYDFLCDWDYENSQAELLAEFGYDATPDEAEETATDVRVWVAYNYYEGTLGAPVDQYASDERGETMVFATFAEAQAWIAAEEDGIYCTNHGEAGRPTYTICD